MDKSHLPIAEVAIARIPEGYVRPVSGPYRSPAVEDSDPVGFESKIRGGLRALALAGAFVILLGSASWAQPTDTCTASTSLMGTDSFPFSGNVLNTGSTDEMGSCAGQGDIGVCFVPSASCSVDITCTVTDSGLSLTAIVELAEGPCGGSTCIASGSSALGNSPQSHTLAGQALTAGTEYCAYCHAGAIAVPSLEDNSILITESSGSCGSLPVELEFFDIDD